MTNQTSSAGTDASTYTLEEIVALSNKDLSQLVYASAIGSRSVEMARILREAGRRLSELSSADKGESKC